MNEHKNTGNKNAAKPDRVRRNKQQQVRLSEEEFNLISEAIALTDGKNASDFMRTAAIEKAQKLIQGQ